MEDLTVSKNVKAARERLSMTQQTLAMRAELSLKTVNNVEAGANCSVATLSKIAATLGVTVADLMATADEEEPAEVAS